MSSPRDETTDNTTLTEQQNTEAPAMNQPAAVPVGHEEQLQHVSYNANDFDAHADAAADVDFSGIGLSAEDVAWIESASDPSTLDTDRLQDLFKAALNAGGAPEEGWDMKESAQAALAVLADTQVALRSDGEVELPSDSDRSEHLSENDKDEEDDLMDFDRISENDDEEDIADVDIDPHFVEWVTGGRQGDVDFADERPVADEYTQREQEQKRQAVIDELGLAPSDEAILSDPYPERLAELAIAHGRPIRMGLMRLRNGAVLQIHRHIEAALIAQALTSAGRSLHGTSLSARLAHRKDLDLLKPEEMAQIHPLLPGLVADIITALGILLDEQLEPSAVLTKYPGRMPTLVTLLEEVAESRVRSHGLADTCLPYHAEDGRRLNKWTKGQWSGRLELAPLFSAIGAAQNYFDRNEKVQGDAMSTNNVISENRNMFVGKPGIIPLSRVLWEILEEDCIVHTLEHVRQTVFLDLAECDQTPADAIRASQFLNANLLTSPFDSLVWGSYAQFWRRLSKASGGGVTMGAVSHGDFSFGSFANDSIGFSMSGDHGSASASTRGSAAVLVELHGLRDLLDAFVVNPTKWQKILAVNDQSVQHQLRGKRLPPNEFCEHALLAAEGTRHANASELAGAGDDQSLVTFMMASPLDSNIVYGENADDSSAIHTGFGDTAVRAARRTRLPRLSPHRTAVLLEAAAIEHLSQLPLLRQRVFQLFLAEGTVVVSEPNKTYSRRYSLHTLLTSDAHHLIEVFQIIAKTKAKFEFDVSKRRMKALYDWPRYFHESGFHADGDSNLTVGELSSLDRSTAGKWRQVQQRIEAAVMRNVYRYIRPQLLGELKRATSRWVKQGCVTTLSDLVAQGPYQPTHVVLQGWKESEITWSSSYECVEALPASTNVLSHDGDFPTSRHVGCSRVCGVFTQEIGRTVTIIFVFIDENGNPLDFFRFQECVRGTPEGDARWEQQTDGLRRATIVHNPEVFAVAATGASSLQTFKLLRRLITHDFRSTYETPSHINVVWTSPAVALAVAGESVFIQSQLPGSDMGVKISYAIACWLRHPLFFIARLFDSKDTVLHLPLSGTGGDTAQLRVDPVRLREQLRWEMSAWIALYGVDYNRVMKEALPELVLQFLPGMGPRKAVAVVTRCLQTSVRSVNAFAILCEELCIPESQSDVPQQVAITRSRLRTVRENLAGSVRFFAEDNDNDDWHDDMKVTAESNIASWGTTSPQTSALLDNTLIPPEFYPIAEILAISAAPHLLKTYGPNMDKLVSVAEQLISPTIAITLLFREPFYRRFQALKSSAFDAVGAVERLRSARNAIAAADQESLALQRIINNTNDADAGTPSMVLAKPESELLNFIRNELVAAGATTITRPYRRLSHQHLFQLITGVT